jgi:ATP-binding cassette subfamily C protein CydD
LSSSEKNVPETPSENQTAFEQRRTREKHCKQWLKIQQKTVSKPITFAALAGISNGLLLVVQSGLLAFILHGLLIEKHSLFANLDKLSFDLSAFFKGLLAAQPLTTQTQNLLLPALLLLFGVMLLRSFSSYLFQTIGFEAAATVKTRVRETLVNHLPQLDPNYLKQQSSGELAATLLEQIEALELYFSRYCSQQQIIAILPLLMIVMVWPINWVVALIFLVSFPLVIFFMAVIGISAAAASRSQFVTMARMGGYFLDRLQGLPTLKLFGQAQSELEHITQVADDFRGTTMKVLRIAFLSSTVLEFFSALGVALIAVYVGLGLLGKIDFGSARHINLQQALFVLLIAPEFFMPLRQLGVFYHDRAAALGAADLILKVLEAPVLTWTDPSPMKIASPFCLELNQVDKHYGERKVLNAINLQIKAGEKIALVGESGAGKTTLFKLLLGFERVDTGQVLIQGQSVNPDYAMTNIAWIGQSSSIFYGSIRDNISLSNLVYSAAEIQVAATAAGVMEFAQALEQGLDTLIGERGYGLSGGQVQRIALARAFLKNAPIVLLDEPTAHLDEQNKAVLLDVIDELFKDKTLVIASHDPAVIERMPRKIVLDNGEIRADLDVIH